MPRHPTADDGTESTATDQALADALDMDPGHDSTDTDELQSLVSDLDDEVSPPVSSAALNSDLID